MLERVGIILQQNCRLNTEKKVLIGVSGGPDSLCLLDLISRLGYPLVVAHFNHRLRPESEAEAQQVAQAARVLGVPFQLGSANVREYAEQHSLSIEEAARILRYQFLFQQAAETGAQAVAVAHNADDQVETILMHLLRGSGLSGLRGMIFRALPNHWSNKIPLVRPLLSNWRSEIEAYCLERGLQPVVDASNQDISYFRNRLRHELIPYLEGYNPEIKQVFWRTGEVLSGDEEIIQFATRKAWDESLMERGDGFVAFLRSTLLLQLPGVQRQVIRMAIGSLRPGLRDIDFETVERARKWLLNPPVTGRGNLAAGLHLSFEEDLVWLAEREADLPVVDWPQMACKATSLESIPLVIPGYLKLMDGWILISEFLFNSDPMDPSFQENREPFQAWANADELELPLTVRCRRSGDRFEPLGMDGHSVNLAEWMVNVRIPRRAREAWPLVCSGDHILWVAGVRLSHRYRLTPGTNKILHLQLLIPVQRNLMGL